MSSELATREKALREDQALDVRAPVQRDPRHEVDGDEQEDTGSASALWLGLASGSARETAVAREGTRGAGGELPYRAELERALGVDLSRVKAFTGREAQRAADQLGAEAYAMRDEQAIVFGDASPSKELVAHEVVHTLQHGDGAVSQDEAEADAVAARIVAGEQVGAEAVQSGGGAVRKKEKTSFKRTFDEFLRGVRSSASEDADALEHHQGDASTVERGADGAKVFHAGGAFVSVKSSGERSRDGAALTFETEEVMRAGTIDPRKAVRTVIANARSEVATAKLQTNLKLVGELFAQKKLVSELSALDAEELDPALVAAKRGLLLDRIGQAAARVEKVEKELAALDELQEELDASEALLGSEDPHVVALALADAEATFRGTTKSRKQSFGFDVLAGKLSATVAEERVDRDEAGTSTSTRSSSATAKLGGGATVGYSTHQRDARTDEDGNVVHATEKSASTTGKYIAREDGTVGVGRGRSLAGAIENSFGKATGEVGLDGAVTTNIVEIPQPQGEDPLYAVVVTIDVGLAVQAGIEREQEVGKKNPAKVKAALSAHAAAAGQLTHTRVLDEQQTKRYLAHLDKVAGGAKPPSSEPELDTLYKALHGLGSVDDVAAGALAQLGSSDAARAMDVDESIELTAKVSAGVDASLGVAGLGASGGAEGERFRTLKIGRVSGKPGQELVEIAVSFGGSSELHGALTASALGVSASYGAKTWGASQEAVTFRLDASQPDYAALYDEIVHTLTREGLIELRTSRRFAKHVQAYSTSSSTGSEESLAIEGLLGVTDKESRERSSERGMADGQLTIREEGTQSRSTGFSVGPLELLRRAQTDGARFDLEGDLSMLDISERTDEAWLGKLDPSAKDYLTSESPAKATEKALLETRAKLEGILLDPEDLDVLARRAKQQPEAWANVVFHVDNGRDGNAEAWAQLRRDLANPKIPNDPTVPIHLARELALATAIADFVSASGGAKGADYLRIALRGWTRAGGGDNTALGTLYEFPADVSAAKYKEVRRKCKGLPEALATFVHDRERGVEPGMAYIAELQYDLAKVLKSVEESYGFDSERARMEMIAELRALAAEIPAAKREFQRQCTGVEPTPAMQRYDEIADIKAQVQAIEQTLEKSKISERWLLDRLDRRVDDYKWGERADQMKPLLDNLEEMYVVHTSLVKELRGAYRTAQTEACIELPVRCSLSSRDERRELDIDYDRYAELYRTYCHAVPNRMGLYRLSEDLDERYKKFRIY